MNGQTVRTALGTIQSNPDATDAWQLLTSSLAESGGDLDQNEALNLLQAARERHGARGESEAVAKLLELSVTVAAGTSEEVALLRELGTVYLEDLFSGNKAITTLRRGAESGDADLEGQLSDLLSRSESYATQVKNYLNEADNASDDDYRSAMLMRATEAEACFSDAPAYPKLIENLELSLRLNSANLPAFRLLEVIYRRNEDFDSVVRVLERAADRAPEKQARVAAGVRLARLYQHRLADEEKAARAFDRVLESDPNQVDAVSFLTEYYSQKERWSDLVRVYERPLKVAGEGDAAHVGEMLQVAMLHWKMRGSAEDAEPWFARIAAIEPAHDGVLNFYREYKESLNDDAGLVQVLEAALLALPAGDERAEGLKVEISERQDDQASAQKLIEKYKSALRENPDDEEARQQLKTLYKQTQGHNALVELLRQQLERVPEENLESRLSIMREIASVYRKYVKSETALVGVLNQIVHLDGKLDEHDVDEVRELVSLYEKLSRPRDLLSSLKLLAEIVPDKEEKISLYRQVGRRWLDQFSNVQHAMESFAALHELAPTDAEATERLEDLYRKRRAWKELFMLYEQQLAGTEGAARVPLLREMAQLSADRLSKVDEALAYYKEILDLDPSRMEVLDRMEKHAERGKNWDTLVEVLERRLAQMPEDESRLPVLQKLGTVYGEHLDRPEDAIGTWRRVVEVQPAHPRAMRVLRDTYLKASRFDDLEELYTSQKDLEGLAEVLSTAADRNKDDAEKLDLSYRAARVYEEGLGQAARAIRSYERILSIDPKDNRAILRVLPLYEQEEKWARIPPLLEVLVETAEEDETRVAMYERLIDLSSGRLADKKAAMDYARRAFESAPENERAVELLDAAARAAGAWGEMVEALQARLQTLGGDVAAAPKTPEAEPLVEKQPAAKKRRRRGKKGSSVPPEPEEPIKKAPEAERPALTAGQRALALRLARVIGEELGQVEEAVGRLKVLAAAAPTDSNVMEALDALLRRENRPEDLRWLYDHRQTHATSPARQTELLIEWALYEEGQLENPSGALEKFDAALAVEPQNVAALEAVTRLALSQNKPERAAEALAQHRDLLSGVDAAHKDAMLADLLADRLKRPEEALEAAKRALDGGAEPGAVIPVLQRLVEVASVRGEAARILSEQYEAGGDSRKEADAVRALISETSDPDEQVDLYKKLADIFEEKLNEPGAALSVLVDALALHPSEVDLWDRAGPLSAVAGRPTDLAEAFRLALRQKLPDDLTLDLARRASELHEQTLGDPQGAVPYYEKILALQGDDEEAFGRLKEILTAGERWRELEELYDTEIQRLDDEARRIEMLAEVALLAEDIMGDAERAISYHKRILQMDEEAGFALESLDRLYTRVERKEPLLELLEKRADIALGEEQQKLRVRFAQLALSLHLPERAVGAIEAVLVEEPGNYEARDIAEELLQIGSVRVKAALALEVVYETKDEIRDLVRVLGVRVDALRPQEGQELDETEIREREDERRDLLRRIATLRDDRLHDDEGSFDVFAELSPLDPGDADLRERLIDSGRRLGRSVKVVAVLLAAAEAAIEPSLKAEIYLSAATVQGDLLDDTQGAEATLKLVVQLRADEPEAALAAARFLEPIFIAQDRNEELALNLKMQIELEGDFDRKGELLARVGHLLSDLLADKKGAIDAWEALLSDSPDNTEALINLTELYESVERYEDVARVLQQRRDASSDDQERANLARHLADVQERHLDNPEQAIESYQAILDETGATAEALSALARLFQKAERFEDLADIYERQSDTLADEVERLGALALLGELRSTHLKDVPGALSAYRRALSVDMGHQPSREALSRLLEHEDAEARLEAAEILHPIYEADADHLNLLKVVEVQASASDDPSFKASRYQTAVRIAEDSLGDDKRAMEFAALGTKEAALHGDLGAWLEMMERLAPRSGARKKQVEVLESVVTEMFDPEQQLLVQKRIGELRRAELGDREGAILAYRKALEFQPEDAESLVALEQLFESSEQWQELLGVLDMRAETAEDETARKGLLFRKARLLSDRLSDEDTAIETYEQILDLNLDRDAISALETLYEKRERFDDLGSMIQRRIDERDGDVATLRVQLASVAAEKQGEIDRGLDELEQALQEDTQHDGAVRLLEKLRGQIEDPTQRGRLASLLEPVYMVRADYDNVLSALSLRLEGSDSPDERRELVTRIAQIHEEQKEDYGAALEITAKLLVDDPADDLTLEEMERLAKVAGAEVRLAELLALQVKDVDDDDATARLCRRAGEIFAASGRDEEALALLERALKVEPDSQQLFDAIDALLKKKGSPEERVALYRNALSHRYDPAEQQKLLMVIAEIEEAKLGNVDAAIDAHRQAVEADETNEASLDALTRLYTQTENYTDLAELYLRRAESVGPAAGAKYRIALVDLYVRKLGQHEPALDQLEEIVRDQPDFGPAIERLEAMRQSEDLRGRVVEILRPIYQAQDDWRHLINLNEDRFLLAEDPMEQVAILRETAEYWETRGDAPTRARVVLTEAYRLQPEDEEVRSDLERLTAVLEDYGPLGSLYAEVLDAHPEMMGRREVVARLAELYDTKLDDPRGALIRYQELSAMDPSDEMPLDAVLGLSLLLGDWRARESALQAKAETAYDDALRSEILSRLGELRHLTLGDETGAIEAYERAFEANERDPDVTDRLIALYEGKDEPARLVDLYLARVEGGEAHDDLQFALLSKAARLLENSLSDAHRAIECLNQALAARPGDALTITELNRLYRQEELWSELLDNLRLEAGTADHAEQRLKVRHEIARILSEKLESFEEALEAYGVVLDEKPDDEAALDAVFALVEREPHLVRGATDILVPALRQTQLKPRLVKALALRLTDEQDAHQRVETLRTMAKVQEEDLGDQKGAFESFLKAIAEAPEATDIYEELARLAELTKGWARFAEVLKARAKETFDSEIACGMWVRLGGIYEEKLGKEELAVEAYQAAAEQVGDRLDLLNALDRLYTSLDDTASVVELVERRMALADTDEDHARLLVRQGQLQLDKQKEPADALSSFRQALERDLHNQEASQQLSRLLDRDEFFEEAFEILDGVYRDRSAGSDLADLHGLRVKRASSAEERLDMRRGLAQVLEDECKDPLAAQTVLQEGFTDDIRDEGLRDEIERLLPITGAWAQAAQALLAATAQKGIDAETGRAACERAAGWLRDKAGDAEAAEKALVKAHEFDPESDEILEQLEALQGAEGREADLLETLIQRAKLAPDEGTRVEVLRRCRDLAEGLGRNDVAEKVLREILESDAEDLNALEGLSYLRRAAGDDTETYALLARRIELESDPDKLRVLKFDSAELARDKLQKLDEAIEIFEGLFEDLPADTQVARALRGAYEKASEYEKLGDLIFRLMSSESDPLEQANLKVGLARLKRDQFKDTAKAIELLEEVFSTHPEHPEAALVLGEIYAASEQFKELTGLLGRQAALAEEQGDESRALEYFRRAATLYEVSLSDLGAAIEIWMKIRAYEDTLEVLESIFRLQLAAENRSDAAASLEEICSSLDGADQLSRRAELTQLYRDLGDTDAVIRTIEGSLSLNPENAELRLSLRKEYEGVGAFGQVADMVLADAEKAEAVTSKVDLLREAAHIHLNQRGDAAAGAEILARASALVPEDRDLLLELCDAYSASGRGSEAVQVLERVVESFGGKRSKELGEIHRRLATAYLSQGDEARALEELDKAFRIEPGNVHVLKSLGEVALKTGDLKKAQQMFRALLLQRLEGDSPITKAEVFCRLGEVHASLGETPKAKQMFERALQTDPNLEAAKTGLSGL